jgi:hypothetical protein
VLKTVSLVLDYLENNGFVDTTNPQPHRFSDLSGSAAPMDNRAKVVRELLETERSYIRDLEMLQVSNHYKYSLIRVCISNRSIIELSSRSTA